MLRWLFSCPLQLPSKLAARKYSDDEYIAISALQHWLYCPRQCALIHLERLWTENRFTAEGKVMHEQAHEGPNELREGVRVARGQRVRSERLGLSGQCDVVEFHPDGSAIPIEYKRGRPKAHRADELQLCAQAICLEEMLKFSEGGIREGYLFYGKRRRRTVVVLDRELRELVAETTAKIRSCLESGVTPKAEYEARKCNACSLIEECQPKAMRFKQGAKAWFHHEVSNLY